MTFALLEYFNGRGDDFARSSSWYYEIEDRLHSIGSFWQRLPLSTEPIDKRLVHNLVSEFYQRAVYKNTYNLPDVRFFPSPRSIIEAGLEYVPITPYFSNDLDGLPTPHVDYFEQPTLGRTIGHEFDTASIVFEEITAIPTRDNNYIYQLFDFYRSAELMVSHEINIMPSLPLWRHSTDFLTVFSSNARQIQCLAGMDAIFQLVPYEYQEWGSGRELKLLIDIAKTSGWISPFSNTCLVSDRPVEVSTDEEGRLHSETGASMIHSDGFSVYSWHGINIPDYVIEEPERITTREVEKEGNIEIRRVLLERYGVERYLQDTHAELIHSDGYGDLFRKEIRNDEPLVMVKVVNSTPEFDGTYKDYFIRVPPTMKTAEEAVAWSGGFEKGSFDYLAES